MEHLFILYILHDKYPVDRLFRVEASNWKSLRKLGRHRRAAIAKYMGDGMGSIQDFSPHRRRDRAEKILEEMSDELY